MNPLASPLLTDLYELTMLQAYFEQGMTETAVFELFVRELPPRRNFLVAAGLEQALGFAAGLRFGDEELAWIERCGLFRPAFAERLAALRFTGDIHAMREGTVFFPNEPVLRVTAPFPEAQLLETRVLNLIHFQTLVASKAARSRLAAPSRRLIDFGLRRSHGAEAGLLAARASYLAGFDGTSTALAAPLFGIPVFGTMAHSFVQAHENERAAFEHFAAAFPDNAVLLIDTYDTLEGARRAVEIGRSRGIKGVRLDSGDLEVLSKATRRILDAGGLQGAILFASGNLDEYRVAELLATGAPIDAFGIGTGLVTSADHPYLDAVYKLQEYAGRARRKRSARKATWPGRKQVYRSYDGGGKLSGDVVTLESDLRAGEPLLHPVMRNGARLPLPDLNAARAHALAQLERLPGPLRSLESAATPYPVEISAALRKLADQVDRLTP
ncbi:MAG: nicotinate phosphoribosyltransferase [Pseudomonadota bacterium]